ncbi:hypothetical protein [Porphyromonas macacae]|uniref:hypothetical protein n=1 Tax=Porphyromonas macacae TaxID=28115 RepID=UPI00068B2D8A|nr:hypothetical protein [Porphyromonas macacae]
MYKLEFELEQHTPIIHFQAKDAGATLRASEVKPKLDKFILTQIGKRFVNAPKANEEECYKEGKKHLQDKDAEARRVYEEEKKKKGNKDAKLELCLIPGQEGALNYKLSFKLSPDAKVQYFLPCIKDKGKIEEGVTNLSNTPYFANEAKIKEPTKGPVCLANHLEEGCVKGIVLIHNKDMKADIEKYLEAFFLLHNFGARQTKGFGSYSLCLNGEKRIDSSPQKVVEIMKSYGVEYCLKHNCSNISDTFNTIRSFHNKLKTGDKKKRSLIREYFRKKEIEWEKPIERKLLSLRIEKDTHEDFPQKYVRALLGLHSLFDFTQLKQQVIVSNENIERFASPIVYKPIGSTIFLILKEIDEDIFGKKFIFSCGEQRENVYTPLKGTFSLKELISTIPEVKSISTKHNEIHRNNHRTNR